MNTLVITKKALDILSQIIPEAVDRYAKMVKVISETPEAIEITAPPNILQEIINVINSAIQRYAQSAGFAYVISKPIAIALRKYPDRFNDLVSKWADKVLVVYEYPNELFALLVPANLINEFISDHKILEQRLIQLETISQTEQAQPTQKPLVPIQYNPSLPEPALVPSQPMYQPNAQIVPSSQYQQAYTQQAQANTLLLFLGGALIVILLMKNKNKGSYPDQAGAREVVHL